MEKIYKEYSNIIYKYLLSLTNNKDTAEELMQETFYSAIKNINTFRKDANIKTWLYKIAKNKWINYYNKSKRLCETNIEDANIYDLDINSVEEDFLNNSNILNIYKKIHKLDESSREVIYLRTKAYLSFKEIGIIIGKSEEWARITFYRAKIKLKEELKYE